MGTIIGSNDNNKTSLSLHPISVLLPIDVEPKRHKEGPRGERCLKSGGGGSQLSVSHHSSSACGVAEHPTHTYTPRKRTP